MTPYNNVPFCLIAVFVALIVGSSIWFIVTWDAAKEVLSPIWSPPCIRGAQRMTCLPRQDRAQAGLVIDLDTCGWAVMPCVCVLQGLEYGKNYGAPLVLSGNPLRAQSVRTFLTAFNSLRGCSLNQGTARWCISEILSALATTPPASRCALRSLQRQVGWDRSGERGSCIGLRG